MSENVNISSEEKSFITSFYDGSVNIEAPSIFSEIDFIDNRYSGEEEFASGGMKEIYSCQDKATGRLIAKAVLKHNKSSSNTETFLREARITASLQHPNILPVYDIGIDDGKPFFTMKLIEGESLETLLEKRKNGQSISQEYLIDIFIKIAEAIAYAHSRGVIHLDIKPDNIQISDYGEVLVCDWGLAKIIDDHWEEQSFQNYSIGELQDINQTMDGFIKGTPGYLSPEHIVTDREKDHRSDIFSLGLLLYEMITNEKAIKGDSLNEILRNTMKAKIIPPSSIKGITSSLEAICLKATQLDPSHRYQSTKELLEDIHSYTRGYATRAEEASSIKVLYHFIKRNKTIFTLCASFLFISLVGLLIFTTNLKQSEAKAQFEKKKAVDALDQFKLEQKKTSFYSETFRKDLLMHAEQFYERGDFERAKRYLKYLGTTGDELMCRISIIQENFDQAKVILDRLNGVEKKELNEALQLFEKLKNENTNDMQTALYLLTDIKKAKVDANDILEIKSTRLKKLLLQKFSNDLSFNDKKEIIRKLFIQENNLGPKSLLTANINSKGEITVMVPAGSQIHSLDYIRFLGNISYLKLSRVQSIELEQIAKFPLRRLDLVNSKIKDISPLRDMPLKELNLHGTKIEDLSPLNSIKTLQSITVSRKLYKSQELKKLSAHIKVNFK